MRKLIPQLDWSGAEVAFHSFWHNRPVPASGVGVQTHYISMVAHVVNRTRDLSALIGIEIMNEVRVTQDHPQPL
eukprot:482491-Prymnesium_polylepis.1